MGYGSARVRLAVPSLALPLLAVLAGCGSDGDYANKPRPPAPINVTAAVTDERISVSPRSFGAGPIVLIVSNQTDSERAVTLETDELDGSEPGLAPQSTGPIRPGGTATIKVDAREGTYALGADGVGKTVRLQVGEPRPSAQNELLQP